MPGPEHSYSEIYAAIAASFALAENKGGLGWAVATPGAYLSQGRSAYCVALAGARPGDRNYGAGTGVQSVLSTFALSIDHTNVGDGIDADPDAYERMLADVGNAVGHLKNRNFGLDTPSATFAGVDFDPWSAELPARARAVVRFELQHSLGKNLWLDPTSPAYGGWTPKRVYGHLADEADLAEHNVPTNPSDYDLLASKPGG